MTTLEEMSGEKKRIPRLPLNEIRLNGQTGKFIYINALEGKKGEEGKKKFEMTDLGEEVALVFLKIRRRLHAFRKGMRPLSSQEHNTKEDLITLYGDGVEVSDNETLRTKYKELRTQQIIYALYKDELIRLTIKGSSLGSENKPKDVMTFYDYIASFKKDSRDDHFYECYSVLSSMRESSDMNSYYTVTFKEGQKLTPEEMKKVEEKMIIAYNYCKEMDAFYQAKKVEDVQKNVVAAQKEEGKKGELPSVQYPEEEIDSEDIPF